MTIKRLIALTLAFAPLFSLFSCSSDSPLKGVVIAVNDSEGGHFINAASGEKLFAENEFEEVSIFSEGLAAVKMNGKWGYAGKDGKIEIPCIYLKAGDFRNGKAKVRNADGATSYIDRKGLHAEEGILERHSFHEGFANVENRSDGKWGFISENEDAQPIPFVFERARSFHEGAAGVRVGGKWGFIDTTGKVVIDCTLEDVWDFSEGLAEVKSEGKWGFMDKDGKLVIPCIYDCGWDFSEELAAVRLDGRWMYIDREGKQVFGRTFDGAWPFSEGLGRVKIEGKHGFIDREGRIVIPCLYDDGHKFKDGLAMVESDGLYGVIDAQGRVIVPIQADEVAWSRQQ